MQEPNRKLLRVPEKIQGVPIIVQEHIGAIKRLIRRLPLFPFRYFIPVLFAEVMHKLLRRKTPSILLQVMEKRKQWSIDLIRKGRDVKSRTLIFNGCYCFLRNETKPFFDALKLKQEYQTQVDDFVNKYFTNKIVIGVHVRYYDKTMPISNHTKHWIDPQESLNIIKGRIDKIISKINDPKFIIYLATDSNLVQDFLYEHFDQIVTYNKEFNINTYTRGQHLILSDEAVAAALVEMFLLAKSDILYRFPPSGSWFSYYGSLYAKEVI